MSQRSGTTCARAALVGVLALLAGPGGPPPAAAATTSGAVEPGRAGAREDFEAERAAARDELVAGLEALAEWCGDKKVYAKRAEVYRRLLRFVPEHEVALRGLGYTRGKDGDWKEPRSPREPKDHDARAAKEYAERNAALAGAYAEALFGLLERHAEELDPRRRAAVIEDVLFADPDDERAHAMLGEARLDDAWVLVETARGKQERPRIKQLVREAFERVAKAERVEPSAEERAFGLEWKGVYATPVVRSLGTGSAQEAERLTQAITATRSLFNAALGAQASYPEGMRVFTLAQPGDKQAFLDKHPGIDPEYRKFLAQLEGSGIQGSGDFAQWAPDPLRRLDGLVRQAIMWLLADGFQLSPKTGWAFEGFGLFLTRELVGTRLTWFVRPSEYLVAQEDNALQARLLDTRTNWMNEALQVLSQPKRPKLPLFLGKDVNQLTTEELLYSYVLAAYLLEAHPESIPKILGRIGAGESSVPVLEAELGRTMGELPDHLVRWLSERR